MSELRSFPVYGEEGQIGTVLVTSRFLDDRAQKTIRLKDGGELQVPADALEVRGDGSFLFRQSKPLLGRNSGPSPAENISKPLANPPVNHPESGPPAEVLAQLPAESLFQQGYQVDTVPIDKIVDGPIAERHDGDTLILSVGEEVWVVEKKWCLREEIRITPRKKQVEKIRTIEKR